MKAKKVIQAKDSGYLECVLCGRVFKYDLDFVPGFLADGVREPLCSRCLARLDDDFDADDPPYDVDEFAAEHD